MKIIFNKFNKNDDSRNVIVFNDDNHLALCVRIYHQENIGRFDYLFKNLTEIMMEENYRVNVSDIGKFTSINVYKNGDKILYVAMSKLSKDKEVIDIGLKLLK